MIAGLKNIQHEFSNYNRNVKLLFLFFFFSSIGRSMWAGLVLSLYIKVLTDSNIVLGFVKTASGLATTLVLIPSGLLADYWRRDGMIRIAAVTGLIGMFFIISAGAMDFIILGLIFWGFFQGLARPSANSLLADSTLSGNRSRTYSQLFFIQNSAMSLGPFINVLLFLVLGDVWELPVLKTVITVGALFSIIAVLFGLFLKDDSSLGDESEALDPQNHAKENNNEHNNILGNYKIPAILMSSAIFIGIGAGMTVNFFPVFFKEQYFLLPVFLNAVTGITSVVTGILSVLTQRLALRIGRIETMVIFQGTAVLALIGIMFYPPIVLLIPLFIFRGAAMNSTNPLNRSIVMDLVPKRNRGKWNALDQLSFSLFWNLSAGAGGLIIGENNNFQACFFITVILYSISTFILLFLLGKVGNENS